MDLDTPHSIEVITVSTSTAPGTSGKKVVPLQIDFEKFPSLDRKEICKLRRPVRPIDRQRMRPWLMELLDVGNVFGLRWTNRHEGIFQISWKHASRLGWNLETDGDVFERWARHTGIYKEGDPPEPKRWKANFRCALHSLHDVVELTNALERRGRNACRTYKFLQSNDEQSISRKRAKTKRVKETYEHPSYDKQELLESLEYDEKPARHTVQSLVLDLASSEECGSETESDASQEDKVIVQKLDDKSDVPEEDYGLHHDHDYSAGPDKTQKTIVLRQGVGSIVLHKEVLSAPDEGDYVKNLLISNLDQLASAAMSSAGLDAGHTSHDIQLNNTKMLKKLQSKFKVEHNEETDEDSDKTDSAGKHYSVSSVVKEESKGYMTRKRKSSLQVDETCLGASESVETTTCSVKKGSKRKSTESCSSDCREETSPSSALSPGTKHRSNSPKILCRRSKRITSKSLSESQEPLMSSCLLLLEAATRLDNAEKNGTSSKSSKSKHSAIEEIKAELSYSDEEVEDSDIDIEHEEIVYGEPVECTAADIEVYTTVSNKSQKYQEILRRTLESADTEADLGHSKPKSRTIRSMLNDTNKISVLKKSDAADGKFMIETPCAKGLFSGSKIQSGSHSSGSSKKRGKGLGRHRKNYFIEAGSSEVAGFEQVTEEEIVFEDDHLVTMSPPLTDATALPVVKHSTDVQQIIIQNILAPIKKTHFPPPIVIEEAGGGVAPSGSSLLQPLTYTKSMEHGSIIKKAFLNLEKGRQYVALENNGKTTLFHPDLFSVKSTTPMTSPTTLFTPSFQVASLSSQGSVEETEASSTPKEVVQANLTAATTAVLVKPLTTISTLGKTKSSVVIANPAAKPHTDSPVVVGGNIQVVTLRPGQVSAPTTTLPADSVWTLTSQTPGQPAQASHLSSIKPLVSLHKPPKGKAVLVQAKPVKNPAQKNVAQVQSSLSENTVKSPETHLPAELLDTQPEALLSQAMLDGKSLHQDRVLGTKSSVDLDLLDAVHSNDSGASSSLEDASTRVKSLSELCKRHLVDLFSTLDNQTSESEDNDSAAGSPNLVIRDDTLLDKSKLEPSLAVNTDSPPVTTSQPLDQQTSSNAEVPTSDSHSVDISHLRDTNPDPLTDNSIQTLSKSSDHPDSMEAEQTSPLDSQLLTPVDESQLMDPTAPLAIREIPLFSSSKCDSDSFSSSSD
ncbi:uncharacterized protein LOC131938752 [Physella acuta]|uniref:uncharacterized protein LOC131938752 n=1 Tax=Physella acuta TaxID=109671 RepID=UPI0027DBDD29|nr:uncharacterized protein LOC131938752 [Physella acuta]